MDLSALPAPTPPHHFEKNFFAQNRPKSLLGQFLCVKNDFPLSFDRFPALKPEIPNGAYIFGRRSRPNVPALTRRSNCFFIGNGSKPSGKSFLTHKNCPRSDFGRF